MKATTLCAATFLLGSVLAVPEVKVIPLSPNSCFGFPNFQGGPGHDVAGPFYIKSDTVDDDAVNDLFGLDDALSWGGVTYQALVVDLRKSTRFAKAIYGCRNGEIRRFYGSDNPSLEFSKDTRNGFLWSKPGYKPQVYAHEINGVRQPGIYLGTQNQTTWGFSYSRPSECGKLDRYRVKLEGLPVDPDTEPTAGWSAEFYGFIKLVRV